MTCRESISDASTHPCLLARGFSHSSSDIPILRVRARHESLRGRALAESSQAL